MRKRNVWLITVGLLAALLAAAMLLPAAQPALAQGQTGSNWQGYYWNNRNFEGSPVYTRVDPAINFNWSTGSPAPGIIPFDNFSIRWYNTIDFAAGTYRFRAGADDGVRVAINGQVIIDLWRDAVGGFQVATADVVLGAGRYEIIVDYYEAVGEAGVLFDWTVAGAGGFPTAAAAATAPALPTATPEPPVKAVVIVDRANVRSGPGLTYPVIAQVTGDTALRPLGRNGDFSFQTWFLVELPDGSKGWIFRQVIYVYNGNPMRLPITKEVLDVPPLPGPVSEPAPVGPFEVQAVAKVNTLVRSAPSLYTGEPIGVINRGETMRVLRLGINRAWVLVEFNGLQGWTYVPNLQVVVGNLGQLPRGN